MAALERRLGFQAGAFSMTNSFYPPRHGEMIPLLCMKCKKRFVGPNPQGLRLFDDILKTSKRAQCPQCKSRRVIPDPWILW